MDLSKSDKKAARIIIEKGILKEFDNGLKEFSKILKDWEEKKSDNRETYHTLYRSVRDFDKHIAHLYDNMTGSHYLFIIIAQLQNGVIDDSDLAGLSEETRDKIKTVLSFDNI
jgi:hypothetical protein